MHQHVQGGAVAADVQDDCYYGSQRPELFRFATRYGAVRPRILDVGCGQGALGARFLAAGAQEVWGVECAGGPAETASTRLSRVVREAFPTEAVRAGAPFDLVVFADSLEHMEDPWEALRFAKGLLAPSGMLLVSAPNVSHHSVLLGLLRGRWDYGACGLLDRTHLRFFTPSTLIEAVGAAGFETDATEMVLSPVRRRFLPAFLLCRWRAPWLVATHCLVLARARVVG